MPDSRFNKRWKQWKNGDDEIPEGTKVKIGIGVNLQNKIGVVKDTASGTSYSIVTIDGKKYTYHNSDLLVQEHKMISMKDLLSKLTLKEDTGKVNKAYDNIIGILKKTTRAMNDDDAYALHNKLKDFFNKVI